MKFTIFTPTHNTQHLARLDDSISKQKYKDFEWLIVPNGGVNEITVKTKQARIVPYGGKTQNIGEIKAFCCWHASGEILVEVDHDDELTPNCLQKLHEAFENPAVDFAYSNWADVANGEPHYYSEVFGWAYRPFKWKKKELAETLAFDPSPASFGKIWYCPNHVRAWRQSFYEKIGGHNPLRDVLDDHELLAKTYIHANEIKHIQECLYFYHHHPNNTCQGERNDFIQEETMNIYLQYIYPMVEKWCDRNGLKKVDLCGGHNSPAGYLSVDLENGDIIADLEKTWPFEDGEVGVFRAHDALEHLRNPIHTMKEAYRCLAPNGWFLTMTPSTDGRGAFQDPTHISFWNENSFWYYTQAEKAAYINTPVRFQESYLQTYFPSEWHQNHNISYVAAHLLKYDGRVPGMVEI